MFVIEVIPLARGVRLDTLSYFSTQSYPIGTLLSVPVRQKTTLAMVVKVNEVSTAKTALRAATFSLRKLPTQSDTTVLSPALIRAAHRLSRQYASPPGLILYSLLPTEVQRGEIPLPHTHHTNTMEHPLPEVLQANQRERQLAYRSLVRETFAHAGSVLVVVPTSVEAAVLEEVLGQGIEDRVSILTSTLSKRALREAYAKLDDFTKPQLIIATPSHAYIERHDITLVIMEQARSTYYKEHARPYLDHRDALRIHAYEAGRRFIFGDLLLRTEEEAARRDEQYLTYGETPKRIELKGKLEITEMRSKTADAPQFELFAPKVLELITDTKKQKGHVFIFAARRGLAPVVACMDCGHIFRSPESGAPYSLVRTVRDGTEERWFVCSTSGQRERAADTCPDCGSWRLKERGIGIQYVHDELRKLLKDIPLILFDHTSASTYKKACFLRDTFYNTKGAVMLGTHMAIPYLTKPIEASVIVSMESLLATPTWRLEEENLALILKLREITHGTVAVQTRSKDIDLLSHAKHASVEHFYSEELELRKVFNYPPFTTFIHLTWQGTKEQTAETEKIVTSLFAHTSLSVYPSPNPPRGTSIQYGLIRVASSEWPMEEIVAAIRKLPPTVRVVINPDRII